MPKAIRTIDREGKSSLTIGSFILDLGADDDAGWKRAIHDGDTANAFADGYLPVRFLGVDTPEVALSLPAAGRRPRPTPIGDAAWQEFLRAPFDPRYPPFTPALSDDLQDHLRKRIKEDAALNHATYAEAARQELVRYFKSDIAHLKRDPKRFKLFYAFAYELVDRYGRLLAFVHPDQKEGEDKLPSYNDRMVSSALALPYFIWPNVDPFLMAPSILDAVIRPGEARDYAEAPGKLRAARRAVRRARADRLNVFNPDNPLQLQPFEVRFLADRRPPGRWVIDLSRRDDLLIEPQRYYEVDNVEDRLYINPEHVPLFEAAGWRRRAR